jgi:hypothetical protein
MGSDEVKKTVKNWFNKQAADFLGIRKLVTRYK